MSNLNPTFMYFHVQSAVVAISLLIQMRGEILSPHLMRQMDVTDELKYSLYQ